VTGLQLFQRKTHQILKDETGRLEHRQREQRQLSSRVTWKSDLGRVRPHPKTTKLQEQTKTATTNPSTLPDEVAKKPDCIKEGKMEEGGGEVMEVDTHQMATEEKPIKSVTENASTTTEALQTAEGALPPPKKMISYYEWQKRHHLWLNSLMQQAIRERWTQNIGPLQPPISGLTGSRTPCKF